MLRGIYTASANWLGRIVMGALLGLIAISFAIWGVGDVFRGFGRSTVATIGGTEITIEQFRQIYNDRLQQISRRAGRPITPTQVRALGIDQQIVGQLVAEAALDERARQLGLNLSNAEIAQQIITNPNFAGPNGQFDRARFDQIIRSAGYNEARYTAEQRRLALRRQLSETVAGGAPVPQTLVSAHNLHENEQRSVAYIVLGPAQLGEMPSPTSEQLLKYFEEQKTSFRAPEYRKVTVLSLTPADIAPWIEVTDEDAMRVYRERKARYVIPERRAVQQIVFANEEEAKGAAAKLANGMSFAQLAAERNLTEKDIDLGLVAKSELVDPAIADAAFSLKAGETSAPVAGRFGTVLVHVGKVEPEQAQPFAAVASEIKREVALERARAELMGRHDKIEDERASGMQLAEVAQKLGLQAQTIEAVDRSGRDPTGQPVADLPRGVDLISNAFMTQVGVEADALEVPGGGYVWYEVVSVQPSRDRTFDEVKERVEQRWREEQVSQALRTAAAAMVEKLKGGATLEQLASELKLNVMTASGLRRSAARDKLPARVLDGIFRTAQGEAGSAEGDSATERVVFRVTEVAAPTFDATSADGRQLTSELRSMIAADLLGQYVAQVQSSLGVSINREALQQVVGGER